jgi:hypothetical protein
MIWRVKERLDLSLYYHGGSGQRGPTTCIVWTTQNGGLAYGTTRGHLVVLKERVSLMSSILWY